MWLNWKKLISMIADGQRNEITALHMSYVMYPLCFFVYFILLSVLTCSGATTLKYRVGAVKRTECVDQFLSS